jgi:3'-phosphoadenosine 5'-phosphosulfate sulfotransferase (PAPS reductase)/FAD synthetase
MIRQLTDILKCEDLNLLSKVETSLNVFDNLPSDKSYHLSFSGGKDSHALLIVFILWKRLKQIPTDNFSLFFADTLLETNTLYQLITNIQNTVKEISLTKVISPYSYWYYQFAIGNPVPNWKNRWCTGRLKIDPQTQYKSVSITGRHLGESKKRDDRLNCNSGECGIDKISNSVDPLTHFSNCDVWDLIYYADNTVLYEGVFNLLKSTYNQNIDSKGSLRMGCFMCPVISLNTLKCNETPEGYKIRLILEKLRKCRRIANPKTKKLGAIYIEDRRKIWRELPKQLLINLGYLTPFELDLIENSLTIGTYPKTYSQEWIDSEHLRLKTIPKQLTLEYD